MKCFLWNSNFLEEISSLSHSIVFLYFFALITEKAMLFLVVMYGCESWTIKKAERWRIDAFELWCWRRLLRVPWTARRWKQSILKKSVLNIHWKDWCWSWNSNTLATWWEELTHWKAPDAGKDWRQEKGMTEDEMVGWHHRFDGHEFEQALGVGDGQGSLVCCSLWDHKGQTCLSDWIELNRISGSFHCLLEMYFYQFDLPINKNVKTLTLFAVLPTHKQKLQN